MPIVVHQYRVRLSISKEMLGTAPTDPDIYKTHLASKAPADADIDEEMATVEAIPEEVREKGKTAFRRDPQTGALLIPAYMIKGYFKEAAGSNKKMGGLATKLRAYAKWIDRAIWVLPDYIPLQDARLLDDLSRPLRASTAQGPRVAIASSEVVDAGAFLEFELQDWGNVLGEDLIRELLAMGVASGLGQWRSAGHGRFQAHLERIGTFTVTGEQTS